MLAFKSIACLFRRQSLQELHADELYEARRELHRAELVAERANAELDMMRRRVTRLSAELEPRHVVTNFSIVAEDSSNGRAGTRWSRPNL